MKSRIGPRAAAAPALQQAARPGGASSTCVLNGAADQAVADQALADQALQALSAAAQSLVVT
tara:strand:- start:612 stop:797 length:186 start_codon:yes stop_codon:yes gene_type:complete